MFDTSGPFVRKELGVIGSEVYRDLDNSNRVIVHHQFADTDTVEGFMASLKSDQFREAAEKGGVILETMEVWVGEEV